MKVKHNKVNKSELKVKIKQSTEPRTTISFYKYAHILDPDAWRDELYVNWTELGVLGRIYVAKEGINAQLSVPTPNVELFVQNVYSYPFLNGIRMNYAVDDDGKSFFKLSIKVKDKIVADGIEDPNFDVTQIGVHLDAENFNSILEQDDVVLIDMRNHYESEVGHFENAICPDVDTFRESLPILTENFENQKEKKIVMYCTGGIRCEKASAFFKFKGYPNVFQLEGGIIEYARQCKNKGLKNKFIGKNFVFDERLGERISDEVIANCHQCGKPCDDHTNCVNEACHLLFIQCDECKEKFQGCCSNDCKDFINLTKEVQREKRKGIQKGTQIFKKGRVEGKIDKI